MCAHCGLPVPAGLLDPTQAEQFCCNGCRTVYHVIRGCGLDRFYRLRQAADTAPQPARTTQHKYSELDDQVICDLYCRLAPDGTQSIEFYLEGVHCAACVWLVEKLPQVLPGVIETRLDLRRAMVEVRWEPAQVHLSRIARTLDSLGYPPHPAKDLRARELRRQEGRRFLIRIGVAGACAGNVMTLAFALYGGVFTGIEAPFSQLFRWASMVFGLIALAWPGSLFFRGAWAALRTRTAHLDLPIAIALAAGGLAGAVNAVLGRGEIYFDSLTMLVLLLLVGRWLQRRQQGWANDALELLFSLTPASARRLEGDGAVEVPIEAVQPGDVVEVRAGDSVPADGTVLDGRSAVNRALLTGESEPADIRPGDAVHAGTVNLGARLLVQVEAVGRQTRVGQLMRLVEEHSRSRAPIVQFADRVAGRFVQVVLVLAALTLGLWLWREPASAIDNAVALLIVTCPCALGLATPLAITIAVGRAARRHILIKGGEALEQLARPGVIFLDKTGTLTLGQVSVVSWAGDQDVRALVAALERHSAHPIARALVAPHPSLEEKGRGGEREKGRKGERESGRSEDESQVDLRVTDVEQTTGGGIAGTVEGRCIVVGSPKFVRSLPIAIPQEMLAAETETIAAGTTPVLVAVDGRCVAVVGLGDPLRADVAPALSALRQLGWHARILSGDHPDVVAAVGKRLGLAPSDAMGGVSPEEKLLEVQRSAQSGPVVMVGDGVNDAAALSAATVGIAVHGGAEASLAAAQVYLDRPGLTPIVELIHAARRTLRAIHRCFAASLCYNSVAGLLAIGGWISPLLAAVLMPLSSFTVLALAFGVRTFGDSE
jgi:Cu2+-exporting ATPase